MKLNFFIILTTLIGCNGIDGENKSPKNINMQSVQDTGYRHFSMFEKDTSRYIRQSFIKRSAFYEGKPLSVLLERLEVPVINYNPMINTPSSGVYLSIYSYQVEKNKVQHKINPEILIIYFKEKIPKSTLLDLIRDSEKQPQLRKSFFSKLIVNRIDTVRYPFNSRLTRKQIDSIGKSIKKH